MEYMLSGTIVVCIGFCWWRCKSCCARVAQLESKMQELFAPFVSLDPDVGGSVNVFKHWTEQRIDELWDCADCGTDNKTPPPPDPKWP